jgi:putative ABC transport system permease protein
MNKLVVANLLRRPLRSVISVLAVAIEVIMILSIVAIFMGMLDSQKERTNGIGADLMLLPSNGSLFNGLGSPSMPIRDGEVLQKLPHVTVVSPAIQKISTSGSVEILYGIDYDSFDALKPFVFLSGGKFQGPNDAIIDDVFAGGKNPATGKSYVVGDTVMILGRPFRISGIVLQGKGGRKLIPLDTMGQMVDAEGKASLFYVKCDNPANDNAVMDEIRATRGFGNNTLLTVDSWMDQMTPDKLPGFNLALEIVTGIAVIIGFLVIFQSMYTAVLERTREIGILKSMGASKLTIIGVVLRECGLLAILGVFVGIAGTYSIRTVMTHFFPTLTFEITGTWIAYAAVIAFAGAIGGALYPAWMAARKDPIEALAYE